MGIRARGAIPRASEGRWGGGLSGGGCDLEWDVVCGREVVAVEGGDFVWEDEGEEDWILSPSKTSALISNKSIAFEI